MRGLRKRQRRLVVRRTALHRKAQKLHRLQVVALRGVLPGKAAQRLRALREGKKLPHRFFLHPILPDT